MGKFGKIIRPPFPSSQCPSFCESSSTHRLTKSTPHPLLSLNYIICISNYLYWKKWNFGKKFWVLQIVFWGRQRHEIVAQP